jgi:transcriptional regulator with XRE-family HTH domain
MTGHEYIRIRRVAIGKSQRNIASRIRRIDGDGSISPQMMNCIEHGRRSYKPYIADLADALMVDDWVLYFFLGEFPPSYIGAFDGDLEKVSNAFEAFRSTLRGTNAKDGVDCCAH